MYYRHYSVKDLLNYNHEFCFQYYFDKHKHYLTNFETKTYRTNLRRSKRSGIKYLLTLKFPEGSKVCFGCFPWYLSYIRREYILYLYIYYITYVSV